MYAFSMVLRVSAVQSPTHTIEEPNILVITLIVAISVGFIPITGNQVHAAGKIKLSKSKISMSIGDSKTIKVKGTSKKATWFSTNKAVAKVNSKGKITAKTSGTATIKAKVAGRTVKCKVTVKDRKSKIDYDDKLIKAELSKEKDYTINTDSQGNAVSVDVPKDNATDELSKGDVIMLPSNGETNGIAMKISSISQRSDSYTLKGESPKMEEVFDSIDIGSTVKVDMSNMDINKDVVAASSCSENNGDCLNTASTKLGNDITLNLVNQRIGKTGKLKGDVTISAPIITADIDIDFWSGLKVNKCNVDVQNKAVAKVEISASSKEVFSPIPLGSINSVALGPTNFYVDLAFFLLIEADGSAVVKCTVSNNTGFDYYGGLDIKPYCNFTKSFEGTKAEIDAKLLANPVIDIRFGGWWNYATNKADWAVYIVDLEVQFGPGLNAKVTEYDTPPNLCADLTVYAYAMLGIKTEDGIGWIIRQCGGNPSWVLLDKDSENALKVSYHIEDWKVVEKCSHKDPDEDNMEKMIRCFLENNESEGLYYNSMLSKTAKEKCVLNMSPTMKNEYKRVVKQYYTSEKDHDWNFNYYLTDFDNDNEVELIIRGGDSTAGTFHYLFDYSKGTAECIGFWGGGNESISAFPNNNGVISEYCHMGYCSIYQYYYTNNGVTEKYGPKGVLNHVKQKKIYMFKDEFESSDAYPDIGLKLEGHMSYIGNGNYQIDYTPFN